MGVQTTGIFERIEQQQKSSVTFKTLGSVQMETNSLLKGGNVVGMRKKGKKRHKNGLEVKSIFSITSFAEKKKESALSS